MPVLSLFAKRETKEITIFSLVWHCLRFHPLPTASKADSLQRKPVLTLYCQLSNNWIYYWVLCLFFFFVSLVWHYLGFHPWPPALKTDSLQRSQCWPYIANCHTTAMTIHLFSDMYVIFSMTLPRIAPVTCTQSGCSTTQSAVCIWYLR